jgi:hypothetical protein
MAPMRSRCRGPQHIRRVPPTLSNRCPGVEHLLPKLRPEAFGFALGLSGPPPPSRSSAWAAPAIHGRLQGDAAPLRCQRSPRALCARASHFVNERHIL